MKALNDSAVTTTVNMPELFLGTVSNATDVAVNVVYGGNRYRLSPGKYLQVNEFGRAKILPEDPKPSPYISSFTLTKKFSEQKYEAALEYCRGMIWKTLTWNGVESLRISKLNAWFGDDRKWVIELHVDQIADPSISIPLSKDCMGCLETFIKDGWDQKPTPATIDRATIERNRQYVDKRLAELQAEIDAPERSYKDDPPKKTYRLEPKPRRLWPHFAFPAAIIIAFHLWMTFNSGERTITLISGLLVQNGLHPSRLAVGTGILITILSVGTYCYLHLWVTSLVLINRRFPKDRHRS